MCVLALLEKEIRSSAVKRKRRDYKLPLKVRVHNETLSVVAMRVGRSFHDRNFNLLSVGCIHPRPCGSIKEPNCYAEMLRIAETLASGESFVRVDLYEIGRPILGELTLHPAAGVMEFAQPEWDLRLGQLTS